MTPRVLHGFTLGALCALVGFGAFAWSRRVDASSAERYDRDLRTLLALEFRLGGEVTKSRSRSIGHYDGIVQSEAAIQRLHERLRDVPAFLPERARADLTARGQEAERMRRRRADLVERFKRENAVLRNSLRYLPVLATELDTRVAETGDHVELRSAIDTVVRDALVLQGWHDATLVDRLAQDLVRLGSAAKAAPPAIDDALAALDTHLRVVHDRAPRVHQLTQEILAFPAVARIERWMAAFTRELRSATDATRADTAVLFVLALAVLLGGAASIIQRMRESAEALRHTSADLERAIASLKVEQEKQRELGDLKSRFVSMTSHEFRTPLSVIVSSSEMVEAYAEKWSAEKKAEHLGRIRAAARSMTRMLDAILLIGRSDAGMLKFDPRPIELDRLCRDVIQDVEPDASEAHRVEYVGPSSASGAVADEGLLRHILGNLLSNALKYSPASEPVQFDVARRDAALVFTVRDRGIGIPEQDRAHLFETFHRGRNVGSVAGTGLGLAIVKRAVDLHGGTVSVESSAGSGTCFTVELPWREAAP